MTDGFFSLTFLNVSLSFLKGKFLVVWRKSSNFANVNDKQEY